MKKKAICLLLLLLLIQPVLGADLSVEFVERNDVIIVENQNNATFQLSIQNNGPTDSFEIYSLVSASIYPKEPFTIQGDEDKTLDISVVPHQETINDVRGTHVFSYEIKGKNTGFFKDSISIKILEVKDAIEIKIDNIKVGDDEAIIRINNKENVQIDDLKIVLSSDFFEFEETISLGEKESKQITVPISKNNIVRVPAGEQVGEANFELNGIESEKDFTFNYIEREEISVSEEKEGFIVQKNTITKTNEGNIPTTATLYIRKDIVSRLFTTFSEKPSLSDRKGFMVDYTWEKELLPGEQLSVVTRTNYTAPFAVILAIILVFFLVRFYLAKGVSLEKRVSFVKTKGGEFALKVKVRIKSNKTIEDVKIIDRIPHGLTLYEKFGSPPHEKDESSRRISWHINRLNAGEERIFTYIIYSKINIVGRFELPLATASYKEGNDMKHIQSNYTSLAAESSERGD